MNFNTSKKKSQSLTKEQSLLKIQAESALEKKANGSNYFKQKLYSESAKEFEKAISILSNISKEVLIYIEPSNYHNLLIECLNNLTICKIKLKEFNEVIVVANKVR